MENDWTAVVRNIRREEVGATGQGVGKRGRGCLNLRRDLRGGGSGSLAVWVGDVGDGTAHWEGLGRIPKKVGLQDDKTATMEGDLREVGVSPASGGDGGDGVTGCGYLRLTLT